MNPTFDINFRPLFNFSDLWNRVSSIFTAPQRFSYQAETLENVWQGDTVAQIQKELGVIAEDFELGKCVEAAYAMEAHLSERGQEYEKISIQFQFHYVWSILRSDLGQISWTGMHTGILFNGFVHCVVHPQGLPLVAWLNDIVTIHPGRLGTVDPAHYQYLKVVHYKFLP